MSTFTWRDYAACLEINDPELFFPTGETSPARYQAEQAKQICLRCPVADWCLQWARDNGIEHGVWGGVDLDKQRRRGRIRIAKEAA